MFMVNPKSINDLCALIASGVPVTLTSHPGNASLYKLVLWSCGIPEHLWDITCCVADKNNWPMHCLRDGTATPLVDDELYRKIIAETHPEQRFITAYQKAANGERLGRIHVRATEQCFPNVISSCSRLLLSEEDKVREMFHYLAETCPEEAFPRFIDADGIMRPIQESGLKQEQIADSFFNVLRELEHLLFSDAPIETKGGACYGGIMPPLSTMLVQFWKTGHADRYDISGPDMIHYASQKPFQDAISKMMHHLQRWSTTLVPKTITSRMLPGTAARVGYIAGHASENIMMRKMRVLSNGWGDTTKDVKKATWEQATDDEETWPIRITPHKAPYFSQYDLLDRGVASLIVDEFWKDISIEEMGGALQRANTLLRL